MALYRLTNNCLRRSLSTPVALYHAKVVDHKKSSNVGTGLVGAPACDEVMKFQIQFDKNGKIIDAKFKTFGCGSAIASSSLTTEWVKGKTIEEASKLKNICSMLAEDAIKAALTDYKIKQQKMEAKSF